MVISLPIDGKPFSIGTQKKKREKKSQPTDEKLVGKWRGQSTVETELLRDQRRIFIKVRVRGKRPGRVENSMETLLMRRVYFCCLWMAF